MLPLAIAYANSVKPCWCFPTCLNGPVRPLPLAVPSNGLRDAFNDGLSLAATWQQPIVLGVWGGIGHTVALKPGCRQ